MTSTRTGNESAEVGGLGTGTCAKSTNNHTSTVSNVSLLEVVAPRELSGPNSDAVTKATSGMVVGKGYPMIIRFRKASKGDSLFVPTADSVPKDSCTVADAVWEMGVLSNTGTVVESHHVVVS